MMEGRERKKRRMKEQRKKERKGTQTGNKEVKILPLLTEDMTFYMENPEKSTKSLLELINKIGKVAEYKINI